MFRTTLSLYKGFPNAVAVRVFGLARASTTTPQVLSSSAIAEEKKKFEDLLNEELPIPYDGPERDHVNFPRRKRPDLPAPVRLGFLPNDWFTFFYKKTGVTGPYLFGTGLLTFVLSKEWWVIEEEFSTGVALFLLCYVAIKKLGPATRSYVDKEVDKKQAAMENTREQSIQSCEDAIEKSKKMVWYAGGQKILMEAKRENVQMQLEAEYRKRWTHVYEQVKKRLDYQLDIHNTRRKMEQKHMVDWIVNNVVKSITPQQEKEALQKCVEDLKALSAQAH